MNAPQTWHVRSAERISEALAQHARERRIIECCQRETERRERGLARYTSEYLAVSGIGAETRRFMHLLADVEYAALAVIDGLDGAEAELQAALEAADYHPLWVASAAAKLAVNAMEGR